MTRLAFDRLSLWIERCLATGQLVRRAALAREDDALLDVCEKLRIFQPAGLAETLVCNECFEAPTCRVTPVAGGRYGYRCLECGWGDVSAADLELVAFHRPSLLAALAAAAGGKGGQISTLARGRLAKLAFREATDNSRAWVVGYADGIADENVLSGVIDALASQFPDGPGLVATPSSIAVSLPLPRSYRFVQLHELFFADNGALMLDQRAADVRLGRRSRTPGRPGRPSSRETTRQIWEEQRLQSDWPAARNEQADRILARWPERGPERPERGSIANQIREFERQASNNGH